MALILHKVWNFLEEHSHPKTKDWWLVSNPIPLASILCAYVYFCVYAGPRIMKNKQPYNLKQTLICYNLAQIVVSAYIFYEGIFIAWPFHYKFNCQPIDYSDDPKVLRVNRAVYIYFINKIVDLLDTVFFVLRKKNSQVTSLHLYHHTIMPIASWIGIKFMPNGHATFVGWLNSFVHVIMYGYYLVAGLGPEYHKYLWWKKHLTTLQLIQFSLIFWQNFSSFFVECNFPTIFLIIGLVHSVAFLHMFGNFYYINYVQNKKKRTKLT